MRRTKQVHVYGPFKVGQSIDDVLRVERKSHRVREGVEFTGKEGTFVICDRGKNAIERELSERNVELNQDFKVRYFYLDCTLTFIKYRGLGGDGANVYRVSKIDTPVDPRTLPLFSVSSGEVDDVV